MLKANNKDNSNKDAICVVMVSLLLNLNLFHAFFLCPYC